VKAFFFLNHPHKSPKTPNDYACFYVYCIGTGVDDEVPSQYAPTHLFDGPQGAQNQQLGYYAGDGLWDQDHPEWDAESLLIQLDVPTGYPPESLTSVESEVKWIFAFSAGIQVGFDGGTSLGSSEGWRFCGESDMRGKLAEYRNHNLTSRGASAVHVMLGGQVDGRPNYLGYTVGYVPGGDLAGQVSLDQGMHLGSTGRDENGCSPYLDSCGCVILIGGPNFRGGSEIHLCQLTALCVAHEVGHALGLTHYLKHANGDEDYHGLMSSAFPTNDPEHAYGDLCQLLDPWPDHWHAHYQINLRTKLGCEVGEFATLPFEGYCY
jgi:hypothetical protein